MFKLHYFDIICWSQETLIYFLGNFSTAFFCPTMYTHPLRIQIKPPEPVHLCGDWRIKTRTWAYRAFAPSLWTWPAWGVAGLSSGDTPTNRQSHSHTDCFHSVRPVLVWLANAHHSTQITPHLLSKKCEFHIYTVQIELMWLKGNGPINLRRLQQ